MPKKTPGGTKNMLEQMKLVFLRGGTGEGNSMEKGLWGFGLGGGL